MIYLDDVTKKNIKEHNPSWSKFPDPDHPYGIYIIGGSGFGKTNSLFNFINGQPDNSEIYLYVKGPHEADYQTFINKRGSTGLMHFKGSKGFIEYYN